MLVRNVAMATGFALLTGWTPSLVSAGPNAGGTLIITENPTVYCLDSDQQELCDLVLLTNCFDADTRADSYSFVAILDVVASFPVGSSPRLSGIVFGLEYDPAVSIVFATHCGDFELPTADWPASGSGVAVTWGAAQTTELTRVYSIVAYSYYEEPALLNLMPHPTQGGAFADDDIPSNIDPIAAYGSLGFFMDGSAPCLNGPRPGACCLLDCSCQVLTPDECVAGGGVYQGDGVPCDPVPCDWPSGACCFSDGSCQDMLLCECAIAGGEFVVGASCEQDPCGTTPVVESTWGTIKQTYR